MERAVCPATTGASSTFRISMEEILLVWQAKKKLNKKKATVLLNYKYCSCILARFSSHHTLACISPNLSRLQCTCM
ncbi:hypothetical protein NC653_016670 [Populus alba x Populus x berolinensis]|uniref:Uncharacterized protein n=1 Tax=Populus alba x Populus x berolinensis TaxID=444605 RepID=A0AAD6VZN5_9ROSI|nr:hypothetical protein NC653_016670 [Populus alba x Populus x berolinensis]